MDFTLPRILADDEIASARVLALRWYKKGLRSVYPIDRLLAFFIAMETIVSTHSDAAGPVPEELARKTMWKPVIDAQKDIIDADIIDSVTR